MLCPRRLLLLWAPPFLWMAVIFGISSQSTLPRGPDPLLELVARKLAHLGEYAVLAILIARALAIGSASTRAVSLPTLAIVLAYAISDELHQGFVPLRTASPLDVGIDVVGGAVGLGIRRWWCTLTRHRERSIAPP